MLWCIWIARGRGRAFHRLWWAASKWRRHSWGRSISLRWWRGRRGSLPTTKRSVRRWRRGWLRELVEWVGNWLGGHTRCAPPRSWRLDKAVRNVIPVRHISVLRRRSNRRRMIVPWWRCNGIRLWNAVGLWRRTWGHSHLLWRLISTSGGIWVDRCIIGNWWGINICGLLLRETAIGWSRDRRRLSGVRGCRRLIGSRMRKLLTPRRCHGSLLNSGCYHRLLLGLLNPTSRNI